MVILDILCQYCTFEIWLLGIPTENILKTKFLFGRAIANGATSLTGCHKLVPAHVWCDQPESHAICHGAAVQIVTPQCVARLLWSNDVSSWPGWHKLVSSKGQHGQVLVAPWIQA